MLKPLKPSCGRKTVDNVMQGVKDYEEGMDVQLVYEKGRHVVLAMNEAGNCCTRVDLIKLLDWVRDNMPELLKEKNGG